MLVLHSYAVAVVFCVITMLCWGSWANTMKLTGRNWRFELFYWDYVLGMVLFAFVSAFTLGSSGSEGRGFVADLQQAAGANLASAALGGVVFNAANILLTAAIDIAGMAVAFPVGIGLALALGVAVNYLGDRTGNPVLIAAGVTMIAAAIVLDAIAYRRLPNQAKGVSSKGLVLSIVAGVLMAFFYALVARSMCKDFVHPEAGTLTPYTAVVLFGLGVLASNVLFNTFIMRKPFTGQPVSYGDYLRGSPWQHLMGIVGGAIWCLGTSFSIIASGQAGTAISYGLGQGATMVAALWGVLVWREFAQAPEGTNRLLGLMFAAYVAGLALLIVAK